MRVRLRRTTKLPLHRAAIDHYTHTREGATRTQDIHPIIRFPSIIVIGDQSILLILLTPNSGAAADFAV
jgi:hypothetical protein